MPRVRIDGGRTAMMRHAPSWIVAAAGAGVMVFGGILWMSGPAEEVRKGTSARPAPPTGTENVRPDTMASLPFASSITSESPVVTDPTAVDETTDEDTLVASLTELARANPVAAAGTIETLPPGELRVAAMRTVFREWAAVAPREALEWIESTSSEDGRDVAREFVYHRVAEDDPKAALDAAQEFGADLSMPMVHDLAQQWAERDTPAAQEWALSLPEGSDRDRILSRVAFVLSQKDPAAAGSMVAGRISPGPEQEEAAMSVLHQWAIRDLEGASRWVANFPPGAMRKRAEEELDGIRRHMQQP